MSLFWKGRKGIKGLGRVRADVGLVWIGRLGLKIGPLRFSLADTIWAWAVIVVCLYVPSLSMLVMTCLISPVDFLVLSTIDSDMVHYYGIMPDGSRMMEQSVKVRQLKMLLASMVVSKDLGSSLKVQGHDNTSHKTLQ
ncbi:hypothetical protein FXO38_34002 [Capsicum annuum]|nr:hypothetical protein FXO38_34002 [Capsicum annuum]